MPKQNYPNMNLILIFYYSDVTTLRKCILPWQHQTSCIMKWVVSSSTISGNNHEMYELWNKDKQLLTLIFHPFTNSVRIESADSKRVFHIRKEGFLRNKIVLRDEYGMKIGQLFREKGNQQGGSIDLNDSRFAYTIENNEGPELQILRDGDEKPVMQCTFKENNGSSSIHFKKPNQLNIQEQMLLMSLCWYTFLPVAKETKLQYAS